MAIPMFPPSDPHSATQLGDHRGTGTTFLQGATSIGSGFRLDGGRVLSNSGTLTWSGGQLLFNNTFNGASGGAGGSGLVATELVDIRFE